MRGSTILALAVGAGAAWWFFNRQRRDPLDATDAGAGMTRSEKFETAASAFSALAASLALIGASIDE